MIIELLIPVISIIGVGMIAFDFIDVFNLKIQLSEKFIYILILSSSILIFPWTIIGLQQNITLFQLWPLIFSVIGLISFGLHLYKKFRLVITGIDQIPRLFNKFFTKLEFNETKNQKSILLFLISTLAIFFILFHLILPIRGYDALWMYIPNSLWFYRLNSISDLNFLNFTTSFKEPLHTLFFTQALYSTGQLYIQLIPVLFFIGWILINYSFVIKIWKIENKALFSVLLFLVIPFTFYIINFWAYYQEIFIGFFYSATILCLFNIISIKDKEQGKTSLIIFYLILGSLSFGLALLAKLSGWVLVFTIILLYPSPKKFRYLQIIILLVISSYLIFKVSVTTYVGIGLVIFIITLILIYLVNKNSNYFLQKIQFNWQGILIIPFGLLIGGFWLVDTLSKFSQYNSGLINLYFAIPIDNIKYIFPGISLENSAFKLESAQGSDFLAISLYILVGNMFVLFWILPKLRSFLDEKVSFFIIWILSFFIIWLTFHGLTSLRYLTPIIVPMIIIVTHGIYLLSEDITKIKNKISNGLIIFISLLAYLSYFFPVPIEKLLNTPNQSDISNSFLYSAYFYYTNSFWFLLFAIILSLLIIFIVKSKTRRKLKIRLKFMNKSKVTTFFLLIIIIMFPFAVPLVVIINSNLNLDSFNSQWNYHQRQEYKEVVDVILESNSPESGIIVFNMPGLPVYLNQPTIDFYLQADLLFPLFSTNITDMLEFLLNPVDYAINYLNITQDNDLSFSFDFVVIPNFSHLSYPFYISEYYYTSFFFSLLFNNKLFNPILENKEFLVFERSIYSPGSFNGIINSYLVDESKSSIFGRILENKQFKNVPNLEILAYYTDLNSSKIQINSTIYIEQNNTEILLNQSQMLSKELNKNLFLTNLQINSENVNKQSFTIKAVTLLIFYDEINPLLFKKVEILSLNNGVEVNYNVFNKSWDIEQGYGLVLP